MALWLALTDPNAVSLEREALLALADRLPFGEEERKRLSDIRHLSALRQSMSGLLALETALRAAGIPPYPIRRTPVGKPYFDTPHSPCFSITHTEYLAAAVLEDKLSVCVGMDAEAVRTSLPYPDIAERFFSAEEQRCFAQGGQTEALFYTLWTKKEALAKLCGKGLFAKEPLSSAYTASFRVSANGRQHYLTVASEKAVGEIRWHYEIKELTIDEIQN